MRQLWCHRVPRPATLPEVQRRRYVGTAAAEARNPRGVDDAGLPARCATQGAHGQGVRSLRCRAGIARRLHPLRGPPDRNNPAKLEFGRDVELTMVPFTTDDNGSE